MADPKRLLISGMKWHGDRLWVAAPEERQVAAYHPLDQSSEIKLSYSREIWDVSPEGKSLWMMTAGGPLGRQVVIWSLEEGREIRSFNCPDGAGSGITLYDQRLWLSHRHNRRLFCLDPQSGKVNWVIRTENEIFSPAAYGNELWLVESDPGPLGHWSEGGQGKYFFSRYDPARERFVERVSIPYVPSCMAFDGQRFWYAEENKKGFFSVDSDSFRR